MQAQIYKKDNIVIINLSGLVDIETSQAFREICLKKISDEKVVLNLSDLNFVGSTGIVPFIETIKLLKQKNKNNIKMCKVKSEFKRIFNVNLSQDIELYNDIDSAVISFNRDDLTML